MTSVKRWSSGALLIGVVLAGYAWAGESATRPRPLVGPNGGKVAVTGTCICEVVAEPRTLRMFLFDASAQPVDASGVRGSVLIRSADGPKIYRFDIYPEHTPSASSNALYLPVDLKRFSETDSSATFLLNGMPNEAGGVVRFTLPIGLPTDSLDLAVSKQKVCPVSGELLGSMGPPIETVVNGRRVSVCCEGCIAMLEESPEKYLPKRPTPPAPVQATQVDADAIKRQGVCPVMETPLGSMGTPWKVQIADKTVFVCCKGCIGVLQREPEKYLANLVGHKKSPQRK